jgi:DNA repair protein RecN (Recombination protein N)
MPVAPVGPDLGANSPRHPLGNPRDPWHTPAVPATLTSLQIRNLALVESLDWQLEHGFTAITGETGSGKSVIVGALKLVLGERADKSLIRTGSDQCAVEAIFEIPDPAALDARLAEHGIEPCQDRHLIIKRVLSASGAGRQFVNCSATTLAALKDLGDGLVDLHGPHDHQSLLSTERQLDLLDAFTGALDLREACRTAHRTLSSLENERAALTSDAAALERELDLLQHQAREIESAEINLAAEADLESRYTVVKNGQRLAELAARALDRLLESEGSIMDACAELTRIFRELESIDARSSEAATAFGAAAAGLEETARALQSYAADIESDPAQLAAIEERINLLETLKRKYGPTLEAVVAFGETAQARLKKIESREDERLRLEKEIADARSALVEVADALSAKRRAAALKLSKAIASNLSHLGFKKSEFLCDLIPGATPGPRGGESAEFLFAPNPGEPLKPLRAVASSGEISRVMLAIKSVLAAQDEIALLVFDEIDANVGGEIAGAVAGKMRELAGAHQVLCVTHLPQVAAAANHQFVVEKEYAGGRTASLLTPVVGESRVKEIARMLGGATPSAIGHAKALLDNHR